MVRAALVMKRYSAALAVAALLSACTAFPERDSVPRDDAPRAPVEDDTSERTSASDDGAIETAVYTPPEREPEPLQRDYPRHAAAASGPAVTSLHQQAMRNADNGDHASAIALLERALRIEPRNAFVWTGLAEQHQAAGNHAQAENTASRANGFARSNPYLETRNWRVIAAARRDSGNSSGAELARERSEQARMRQDGGG